MTVVIEKTYVKKTPREHVLLRPDTYVGSLTPDDTPVPTWLLSSDGEHVVREPARISPALFKIFDEVLVNAADNRQRDPAGTTLICVDVRPEDGSVRIWNNGAPLHIDMHAEHGVRVPELVYGSMLSGSNFNDDEERLTGGRNGYGSKLANVLSSRFVVDVVAREVRAPARSPPVHYHQVFEQNMGVVHPPVLRPLTPGSESLFSDLPEPFLDATAAFGVQLGTCVTFFPDVTRFGGAASAAELFTDQVVRLFLRRALDVAATAGMAVPREQAERRKRPYPPLAVRVNGGRKYVFAGGFADYLKMYEDLPPPLFLERLNDRWEVGLALSQDGVFQHVSFVNGIATSIGGTHVSAVADQICAALRAPGAPGEGLSPAHIRSFLVVYVNARVVNPEFSTQTKTQLTTPESRFRADSRLTEAMLTRVVKNKDLRALLSDRARSLETTKLGQTLSSSKTARVDVPKLVDAAWAGTARSAQCTLFLTEGDSAKTLAMSGFAVVGTQVFGVFPLRGKLLNVYGAAPERVRKNAEIESLVKILGLRFGAVYTAETVGQLRYGHVAIMADQDVDGSHIKGLLMNFFATFWPSLLTVPGFLQQFITPLLKATPRNAPAERAVAELCGVGRKAAPFYTMESFQAWAATLPADARVDKKYYKGLGTSTATEAREYFEDLPRHLLSFRNEDPDASLRVLKKAFNPAQAEERKQWITQSLETPRGVDYADMRGVSYEDFTDAELVGFSREDVVRSIPSVLDGFKPSQRKVLFAGLKLNLTKELKVAQFAGRVAELTDYHHGEQSLVGTVVNMAQNFPGSNNTNLFRPAGQFGTRLMGGGDAASARYIFTHLEPVARALFPAADDPLLEYRVEDGVRYEPVAYYPVIPMLLVNGAHGIGTGWATNVPMYNPSELVDRVRAWIRDGGGGGGGGGAPLPLLPWYRGFTGEICRDGGSEHRYLTKGVLRAADDGGDCSRFSISELPVGVWTDNYVHLLKTAKSCSRAGEQPAGAFITEIVEDNNDIQVNLEVRCDPKALYGSAAASTPRSSLDHEALLRKFGLVGTLSTSNMHAFDARGLIRKFESAEEILGYFCEQRRPMYVRRRAHLLAGLRSDAERLANRARMAQCVSDGTLVLTGGVSRRALAARLTQMGFATQSALKRMAGEEAEPSEPLETSETEIAEFDYLVRTSVLDFTKESMTELFRRRDARLAEIAALEAKSGDDLWLEDLNTLEEALQKAQTAWDDELHEALEKAAQARGGGGASSSSSGKKGAGKATRKRAAPTAGNAPRKRAATAVAVKVEAV